MPRPYLVGWYYALKDLRRRYKIKPHRKIWLHMLRKKYYWLTPEERVKSMQRCLNALKNIPSYPTYEDYEYELCRNCNIKDCDDCPY